MNTYNFPIDLNERNTFILDQINQNNFENVWHPITSTYKNIKAIFFVSSDAIKINGIRFNVSAKLEKEIANMLDASLLTAKLADLIHVQADIQIVPAIRKITSETSAMIENSIKIDGMIGSGSGLISTVGKHWIFDPRKPNATINYGWHFSGASFQGIKGEVCASLQKDKNGMYYRVVQGAGFCHNDFHVDYSQICVLLQNNCDVDGVSMRVQDVLSDNELKNLMI